MSERVKFWLLLALLALSIALLLMLNKHANSVLFQ